MALSGSTDYNLTATQLIELAYQEIGDTPIGQAIPGELLGYGMKKLNILLKSLRNRGIHLHVRDLISITPVAGQFKYTIGPVGADITAPRPFKLLDAYYRRTADKTNQVVTILTRDTYFEQSGRESTNSERITQIFYDPTLVRGTLYTFPVPNTAAAANYTLEMFVLRQFDDVDSPADDIQIPPNYYKAVLLQLAYDLSLSSRLSVHERGRLAADAEEAMLEAIDADQEEYIQFMPEGNNTWQV